MKREHREAGGPRKVAPKSPFALDYPLSDDPAVQAPVTASAEALAHALARSRRRTLDGRTFALLGASGDTLAVFFADPPRLPGPFDNAEWVLESAAGTPAVSGTRASVTFSSEPLGLGRLRPSTASRNGVTFSSEPLGPGPTDGFDRVGGYSGCNWFGTGYRLDELGPDLYRLTVNQPPMSTVRGCISPEVSDQERAIQGLFYGTSTLRRRGDRLTVIDCSDRRQR